LNFERDRRSRKLLFFEECEGGKALRSEMEYKYLDVAGCSFGELHNILTRLRHDGWELDRVLGPEQLPETALYGKPGELHLWLRRQHEKC
jgi:hypothetical protein